MKDKNRVIKLGFIGCGKRGVDLINTMMGIEGIEICALSDVLELRMQKGLETIRQHERYPKEYQVDLYGDYKHLLARQDIEGVVIATSWNEHVPIAIDSMLAGKYVGLEVCGANSIEECWDLVKTYEKTKSPLMFLENCCYGQYELAVLNMIRQGLFGEVIHCAGGYQHDLAWMVSLLQESEEYGYHQRSYHHMKRNAELYPTHEIGPIAKYLNINRGNRFLSLTSTASKSVALDIEAEERFGRSSPLWHHHAMGDIVTTVLKCAGGETVVITHDISLPRPYSRGNTVHGTKGIWSELNNSIHIKGISPEHEWEDMEPYLEKYQHPIWKEFLSADITDGHGGMDYLVQCAFIESIRNGTEPPIDVYDAATWKAICCLSEQSISLGSTPVPVPDFTNGKWIYREPAAAGKYALD